MAPVESASTIGRGTVVRGSIHGEGDLEILGRVEGSVTVSGELAIGDGALVKSDVSGRRVTVRGAVAGNVSATEAIVLEPGARVVGDLGAPQIGIRPGALVRGLVSTGAPARLRRLRRHHARAPGDDQRRRRPSRGCRRQTTRRAARGGAGGRRACPARRPPRARPAQAPRGAPSDRARGPARGPERRGSARRGRRPRGSGEARRRALEVDEQDEVALAESTEAGGPPPPVVPPDPQGRQGFAPAQGRAVSPRPVVTPRERLVELLRERSFERKRVVLASGRESDFFIDCKQTVLTAEGHALVGELMFEALDGLPRAKRSPGSSSAAALWRAPSRSSASSAAAPSTRSTSAKRSRTTALASSSKVIARCVVACPSSSSKT